MSQDPIPTRRHVNSRDLVSLPQVLWAAWLRVDDWYRSGNLAPQPELSVWRLHPEAELRNLGHSLRAGAWKPSRWLQVPYPKKGMSIRHYWMPTVKDQVAFMAHMVLLGPLLDCQIPNFAFGNRWYRPIAWDRRSDDAKWVLRPYPFLNSRTYQPYSRSHGLYRRVANWTVSQMVDAEIQRVDFSGPVQTPGDYPENALPEWTRESWWPPPESGSRWRAHWAALDLQLAFPSVQLRQLSDALMSMVSLDSDSFQGILGGYPGVVVEALGETDVRQEIARDLVSGLDKVEHHKTEIPEDAWRPPHATQRLPPENPGLPTGLAISGLLLNVVLYPADRRVLEYLKSQQGDYRGAFLRFADDMTVLSRSASGLFALTDEVWRAIASDPEATLAVQESRSNLRLNVAKIGPTGVQEVLLKYLENHDWQPCDECKAPCPPSDPKTPKTLEQWWAEHSQVSDDEESPSLPDKLNRATVGPNEMGPFVTTLVERLSEIGRDTLVERFGQGARNRLIHLHELARLNIDDQQVRPDTRRAFAANRLVSAWLPLENEAARKEISEIRDSIAFVLQETPWKFTLWRAVVRAAGRRPAHVDNREDDQGARNWLSRVLGRIACHDPGTLSEGRYQPDVWAQTWPEVVAAEHHDRNPKWRSLYLSFHRAAFWHALANEIASLRRHEDRITNPPVGSAGPSPKMWAVRAIPEGKHGQVADSLADLDKWVEVLYPDEGGELDLSLWSWELDQLVVAVLATARQTTLAEAWFHCEEPGILLMVPEAAIPAGLSKTTSLLRSCNRVQSSDGRVRNLSTSALAHVYLGTPDSRLSGVLFPDQEPPRIDADRENTSVVMMGIALRCSDSIPTSLLSRIVAKPATVVKQVQSDPLKLREYGRARSVLVTRADGLGTWKSRYPTLHRLLWGLEPGQSSLSSWKPRPWEIPAVGLTVSLAVRLFDTARNGQAIRGWDPRKGPLTWALRGGYKLLSLGRRLQFAEESARPDAKPSTPKAIGSAAWEAPPHPAYFLPFVAGVEARLVDSDGFAMYCDVLLLLTALDGGEAILHGLAKGGAGSVPFEDRWAWRSRIHLPLEAWQCIERVIRWPELPTKSLSSVSGGMQDSLRPLVRHCLSIEHHYLERVDIRLEPLRDIEVVRTVRPQGSSDMELPEELRLNPDALAENLVVRICQVARWPDKSSVVSQFPKMDSNAARQIMEQVASAFQSPRIGTSDSNPELVVLPEVSVPESEAWTIRKLVEAEGRASLAGLYWRELRPAYPAGPRSRAARCWFVNEAELVIPIGIGSPGPTSSRWFRVRKPVPAHVETGLARALSATTPSTQWSILRGQRWHRFLHPQWGDFTVAVCADLLDAAPWRSLRGELLHLFMVAFNRDVDLYEALTWVRAYETYVNLVAVNHGQYGGSFLWTPRRSHERELAQLRGKELFLLADVELPVKELAEAQRKGVADAICVSECFWRGCQTDGRDFKAPPPGYQRTC